MDLANAPHLNDEEICIIRVLKGFMFDLLKKARLLRDGQFFVCISLLSVIIHVHNLSYKTLCLFYRRHLNGTLGRYSLKYFLWFVFLLDLHKNRLPYVMKRPTYTQNVIVSKLHTKKEDEIHMRVKYLHTPQRCISHPRDVQLSNIRIY